MNRDRLVFATCAVCLLASVVALAVATAAIVRSGARPPRRPGYLDRVAVHRPVTSTPATALHPAADGTVPLFTLPAERAREGYGSVVLVDVLLKLQVSNGADAAGASLLKAGDDVALRFGAGQRRSAPTHVEQGVAYVHFRDVVVLTPESTRAGVPVALDLSAVSSLTPATSVWITPVVNSLLHFLVRV